eukprot:SAG25_NODE_1027_length_4245_cov_3.980463_1_plen_201_part_00
MANQTPAPPKKKRRGPAPASSTTKRRRQRVSLEKKAAKRRERLQKAGEARAAKGGHAYKPRARPKPGSSDRRLKPESAHLSIRPQSPCCAGGLEPILSLSQDAEPLLSLSPKTSVPEPPTAPDLALAVAPDLAPAVAVAQAVAQVVAQPQPQARPKQGRCMPQLGKLQTNSWANRAIGCRCAGQFYFLPFGLGVITITLQ